MSSAKGASAKGQLASYRKKRTLDTTPEPSGDELDRMESTALRFVVQKHHASHLHYDFRLEGNGVLKSWAIPKGPSMNPADKRLAMFVEDHPMAYRNFEGVIPKGNYGAGSVIIWDEGTYVLDGKTDRASQEKLMKEGMKKGKLTFAIYGEKLKGRFHMVKMHGREENSWLIFKENDDEATTDDIREQSASVRSNKTIEEIAANPKSSQWLSKSRNDVEKLIKKLKPPKGKMPRDITPMLATLVDDPFDHDGWLFEIKWDGYRAVSEIDPGEKKNKVRIYSRNNKSFNARFSLIAEELAQFSRKLVLDGEVVGINAEGKPEFNLVKNHATDQDSLIYYVFDCLHIDGHDLSDLTLIQRKEILKAVIAEQKLDHIRYCDHVDSKGNEFFKAAEKQGLEGIIAKNAESPYQTGTRSRDWLKIKSHQTQEAVIVGYTAPRGSRQDIGALILAVHDKGKLTYIGHTGTGMDTAMRRTLKKKLDRIKRKTSAVTPAPKTNAPATWTAPQLVCEVEFTEWTPDGHLRHPVFMHLREDKKPEKVKRELPVKDEESLIEKSTAENKPAKRKKSGKKAPEKKSGSISYGPVIVSHPEKIYFPKLKITKQDVIEYYDAIAPYLLPYTKSRPMVLNRYPDGIHGSSFYHKDNPGKLPDYVETVAIYSESNDKMIHYIVGQNKETLLYMANLGSIEMNAWNATIDNLDNPSYLVIDLDPEGIGFEAVIECAQAVKELLDELKLTGFCKTSGKTGLHIYLPTAEEYSHDIVRQFAQLFVTLIHQRLPKTTSLERKPVKRQHKIYLDFLQNRRGQTMAVPYSLRPVDFAGVSTPLEWKEVKPGLDPADFNIHTITERVKKNGDLWKPLFSHTLNIPAALKKLQAL